MAFLDEANTVITSNTTEAGSGTSFPIYKGHLPDSTVIGDRAVALLETQGTAADARTEREHPGLQIIVRGQSMEDASSAYQEAQAVAVSVRDAVHEFTGTSSSGAHKWVGAWNENGPFFGGLDASKRVYFSQNFRIQRSRTT